MHTDAERAYMEALNHERECSTNMERARLARDHAKRAYLFLDGVDGPLARAREALEDAARASVRAREIAYDLEPPCEAETGEFCGGDGCAQCVTYTRQ